MAGCTRTVLEQDVYTALYGYGAGLPYTDSEGNYVAGYRRKLTFGDINGGLDYVEDTAARDAWDAGTRTARRKYIASGPSISRTSPTQPGCSR